MTAPVIPRRTSAALRTGLRDIYMSGWRRGVWQGFFLGAMVTVLAVEAVRAIA
jgi:hypothetical protein